MRFDFSKIFLCLFVSLLLLTSCTTKESFSENNFKSSEPINTTVWLTFSSTKYSKERAAIKQYFQKDYQVTREVDGDKHRDAPIYIAKHDLNNDGKPELIVVMVGTVWGGVQGYSLEVMSYNNGKIIDDCGIANFAFDEKELAQKGSQQVGIVRRDTGNYDFMILGSLWKYSMNWNK